MSCIYRFASFLPLLVLSILMVPCHAQGEDKVKVNKVAIIGASLSKGFTLQTLSLMIQNPRVSLESVLKRKISDLEYKRRTSGIGLCSLLRKAWSGNNKTVNDFSDMFFFREPVKRGKIQQKRVIRCKPQLVLGLDYLFWFGYGQPVITGKGKAVDEQERFKTQTSGLAQLDDILQQTSATIVLGDYPKLKLENSFIIPMSFVPAPETLKELNRRLYAWAKSRKRIHIWPLAATVNKMYKGGYKVKFAGQERHLTTRDLLQADLLHPTRLGMAFTLFELDQWGGLSLGKGNPFFSRAIKLSAAADAAAATDALANPLKPLKKVDNKTPVKPQQSK